MEAIEDEHGIWVQAQGGLDMVQEPFGQIEPQFVNPRDKVIKPGGEDGFFGEDKNAALFWLERFDDLVTESVLAGTCHALDDVHRCQLAETQSSLKGSCTA